MDKDFNKRVFETFPDAVWTGGMPALDKKPVKFSPVLRAICQVAAAVCIVFSVATLLRPGRSSTPENQVAGAVKQSALVYRVNDAVRASMVLPDSTAVTLNSGSTLTLSPDFGTGNRVVHLDGEALFEVHRNKAIPFIVNTPQGVEVKVTGTKFNMSCYSDNAIFDLTLLQGSVEVTTRNKEVLQVKPSEEIIIKDGFHNISPKEAPQEAADWTEGILRFDHTSMKEAIARIEKWYGVRVVVDDDTVYRNSITGTFDSESLDEVLHLICITSRLDYAIREKTVHIRPRK